MRVFTELLLGLRLAFAGGRRGWTRTAMASAAIAIGAAALLLGASVPVMLHARHARTEARSDGPPMGVQGPAARTVAIGSVNSRWGSHGIRGRLIWPESPGAPLPPGVRTFPGDHQMYASPALRAALAGPDGESLRRQIPYEVVGTIAPDGLDGPQEWAYYAGYPRAAQLVGAGAKRVDRFGYSTTDDAPSSTYVIVAVMMAALLLPIAIIIAAALRFGATTREQRLAAVRLVGADSRAVLRIALCESLVPAGIGLAGGAGLYLLAASQAAHVRLFGISVYPADIRPVPGLAVLVVVAMLALTLITTLLGFRGVSVEPLGVFRRSTGWHGRLWWRLVPLGAGLALLAPVLLGRPDKMMTGAGGVLLIASLIPLLPYLVPVAARVLPGGSAAWQLASQQLRRNPAMSTRAVTGIAVAVAGTIALHTVFAAATADRASPANPTGPAFILRTSERQSPDGMRQRSVLFDRVGGAHAGTVARYSYGAASAGSGGALFVGDCAALGQIAVLDACADGDVFVSGTLGESVLLRIGDQGQEPAPEQKLSVPAGAHRATMVDRQWRGDDRVLLLTPSAAPAQLLASTPLSVETRIFISPHDAIGGAWQVRGVAAGIDPLAQLEALGEEYDKYAPLRLGLDIGATLVVVLLGAGLLLDMAERLQDRRRLLAVLAAVGARRSTVIWSVLLQAIVPVLAGLALAAGAGTVLGLALTRLSYLPIVLDLGAIAVPLAVGAGLVLATSIAVLLPAARRVTRTDNLRYE